MGKYYRIYGREKGEKRFMALDLHEGTFVNRLIYATILTKEEADGVFADVVKNNPNFEFKIEEA